MTRKNSGNLVTADLNDVLTLDKTGGRALKNVFWQSEFMKTVAIVVPTAARETFEATYEQLDSGAVALFKESTIDVGTLSSGKFFLVRTEKKTLPGVFGKTLINKRATFFKSHKIIIVEPHTGPNSTAFKLKTPAERELTVHVRFGPGSLPTVKQVKRACAEQHNIPAEMLQISFEGDILDDDVLVRMA